MVSGLGSRGQVARSEGGSEKGVSKWPDPKEASGLAFGTGVILRRLPKEVPAKASKGAFGGHSAGLRDGSEGFIGRGLREYVSLSERLRKGLSGWRVPKVFSKGSSGRVGSEGVFEGCFREGVFERGSREGLRRRLRRGLPD